GVHARLGVERLVGPGLLPPLGARRPDAHDAPRARRSDQAFSRAEQTSRAPRANSWNWLLSDPSKASRIPALSQVTRSAATITPATRPTPPDTTTPPRTAIVMAGSAMPLPTLPASGRAEANCATMTTAAMPERSPEAR